MKKSFIAILLFYLTVHIIAPFVYYQLFGFEPFYYNINNPDAISKAFWLNVLSVVMAFLLIKLFPVKNNIPLRPRIKRNIFPIFLIVTFYYFIIANVYDFQSVLSGDLNGTFLSYLNTFLHYGVFLLIMMAVQENKINLFLVITIYVFLLTLKGSRSGAFYVFFLFFLLIGFENFRKYKKQIIKFGIIMVIVSPMLFYVGTTMRSHSFSSYKDIFDMIVARVSYLETGALPIDALENNRETIEIFYEKYHIQRQIKLMVDRLFLGYIFYDDVDPNQYYRVAFMGHTELTAQRNYTSINMTLPVYLYMYFGYLGAVLISAVTIFLMYLLLISQWNKNLPISVALLLSIYPLLTYFDFVMMFGKFLSIFLTTFIVIKISKIRFRIRKRIYV